jgi:glycerophosphoryl diester phosphodiesterase
MTMDENVAKALDRVQIIADTESEWADIAIADWQTIRARLVELEAENERLRTHHAEIAEAVADAELWRHARDNTGNGLRVVVWNKGAPDNMDVIFPSPNLLKNTTYIDAAIDAQHNSAREG